MMGKVQVLLRFPEGHWIEKMPKGVRAKLIMEILDMNAKHDTLKDLQQDIREIKSMMLNQDITFQPTKKLNNNGNDELMVSILRIGDQQHGNL